MCVSAPESRSSGATGHPLFCPEHVTLRRRCTANVRRVLYRVLCAHGGGYVEARGGRGALCSGSFTAPGAGLVASKSPQSFCLCPSTPPHPALCGVEGCVWPCLARDLNLQPHACVANALYCWAIYPPVSGFCRLCVDHILGPGTCPRAHTHVYTLTHTEALTVQ